MKLESATIRIDQIFCSGNGKGFVTENKFISGWWRENTNVSTPQVIFREWIVQIGFVFSWRLKRTTCNFKHKLYDSDSKFPLPFKSKLIWPASVASRSACITFNWIQIKIGHKNAVYLHEVRATFSDQLNVKNMRKLFHYSISIYWSRIFFTWI